MFRRFGKGLLATALLGGCNFGEAEGRPWVERVLGETPRIAQLAFGLREAPASTYNTDGRYPDWVGAITFQRFTWTRVNDTSYEARAVATMEPGPRLRDPSVQPTPTRASVEVTVEFTVHTTPPPVMFLPAGHDLAPTRWRLHSVNGQPVSESGPAVDYRTP